MKKEAECILLFTFLFILLASVNGHAQNSEPIFSKILPEESGIDFSNNVPETDRLNIMFYPYHYNGGGVAVGDINNDGLADIFFVSNYDQPQLYLNKGNFKFDDITSNSGIVSASGWSTGVTMVDINQDGYLDIYVCRSGEIPGSSTANLLFINNGDLTFSERASAFGLADDGYGTQAAFFDMDADGDLDMFLINHNIKETKYYDAELGKNFRHPKIGDKLYKNEGGWYLDVSQSAGIKGNIVGYGLGLAIGDINKDGLPDIYVGNDFMEPDYLYYNNGNGTFSEKLKDQIKHVSNFSMGTDLADYNNDGFLDIVVVDMVAEDNYRQKTNMKGMNPELFWKIVNDGQHYQYMKNTLQLNNGNGSFSEIGSLAGITKTDWSWSPLLADFDNDGFKDLFVSNGLRKDVRNNDFTIFMLQYRDSIEKLPVSAGNIKKEIEYALSKIPSQKVSNYMFRNGGNLKFDNVTEQWGLKDPGFSTGAAYADFDNDGDLDLVTNNIDETAFLYKNNTNADNRFLSLKLHGSDKNINGIGSKIEITTSHGIQYYEHFVSRGFQSSSDHVIHIGLGDIKNIERITIIWPNSKMQELTNVKPNQVLTLNIEDASKNYNYQTNEGAPTTLFENITKKSTIEIDHIENEFDDFNEEILLPHKLSNFGPGLAVADVNGDGLDDFYVGGATGYPGNLVIQVSPGKFENSKQNLWEVDKTFEDLSAEFFDFDNDKDLDLFVVSGGNEQMAGSPFYRDRLYRNDGKGNFEPTEGVLPDYFSSGSVVKSFDFDNDGDLDLFVGSRLKPREYPFSPQSHLLLNENGKYREVTNELAPALSTIGMVTDAAWTDVNNDNYTDLILVGEWMPITVLLNQGGAFKIQQQDESTTGWWFSVLPSDFDNDGDMDFVVGNLGLNYKYKAKASEPFEIYAGDLDANGDNDILLGYYNQGNLYPVRGRECSSQQIPSIKSKFKNYDDFGRVTLPGLLDVFESPTVNYKAHTFESSFYVNDGNGNFHLMALPIEAQISPVNTIIERDFDKDGLNDLLIAGNLYASEVETPRADAGIGLMLKRNDDSNYIPMSALESGFFADGDVKEMKVINLGENKIGILVAQNNGPLRLFSVK